MTAKIAFALALLAAQPAFADCLVTLIMKADDAKPEPGMPVMVRPENAPQVFGILVRISPSEVVIKKDGSDGPETAILTDTAPPHVLHVTSPMTCPP